MALGDNSALVTSATSYTLELNNKNDIVDDQAPGQATAYVFQDGKVGDDRLEGFNYNDTVINYQQIFDGNNDGIINLGSNFILDIDRTSRKAAGADQITLGDSSLQDLRYLGSKQGGFVYADYRTFTQLDAKTDKLVLEGTVNGDTLDASKGDVVFLYDTSLGLNLGGDKITGFGVGDELVTTTKIHNGADAGALVTFGNNDVLDLPGDTDGIKGDVGPSEGGQIDFGANLTLALVGTETGANGATYYHYALAPSL